MRALLLATALCAAAPQALADGFMMGAGRWTCGEVSRIQQNGTPAEFGQLAGWILGFWSAATLTRETSFVDTVENAGGKKIYEATLAQCQKAGPDVLLYRVARGMVANTK